MKHKITRTKIKRIHFYETCVKKRREIQYYAMIRMGGFVLPMQKSDVVLSGGVCPGGFVLRWVCPPTLVLTSVPS